MRVKILLELRGVELEGSPVSRGKPLAIKVEDNSDLIFANRVSTLKLRVKNLSGRVLRNIYLAPPPDYREEREVKGKYGDLQLMWGGGIVKGCLIMLPKDRTELKPGEEGIAYFFAYPEGRKSEEIQTPLNIYIEDEIMDCEIINVKIIKGDIRAYVYRPRYVPRINESILPLVKKVIEDYGVPDVETRVWPVGMTTGVPGPKVEIFFEDKKVAEITGDIGSGFMHIAKIKVHRNVFIAEALSPKGGRRWYWVARIWFFWLDKNVFDEVPDGERVELWINPETEEVDWLITDAHWKEVAYRGPVECAEVKITGGLHKTLKSKLTGLVKSYHAPRVENMERYMISSDSRDPRKIPLTVQGM